MMKPRVIFLCTGNSCRSQMAEGFARAFHGDALDAASAGTAPQGLNPLAVKVMAERGVDISAQRSKHLDETLGQPPACVITVCGAAHEQCPLFPGNCKVLHMGFDDPPYLARSAGTEDEALEHYRRVRDQIAEFVLGLPEYLSRHGVVN